MTALEAQQQADLRRMLDQLERELEELLADSLGLSETVQLDQARVGRLSRMDALQHQAMAQEQRRRASVRLDRVRARIAEHEGRDPDFGLCRTCLEAIPWARLTALPDALFCVDCQDQSG